MYPIIFHTSKTMSPPKVVNDSEVYTKPELQSSASSINDQLIQMSHDDIKRLMKVSDKLADDTMVKIEAWSKSDRYRAIEYFSGDIYRGIDAESMSASDFEYAQGRLIILSGLYGILKPLDLIATYRLEMGYALSVDGAKNLYEYWLPKLKKVLPKSDVYIHASSEEYFKAIRPVIDPEAKVIAPVFLTSKNGEVRQVTIHTKVARGAYVNWIIKNRIEDLSLLSKFDLLDYQYSEELSTELSPTYIKQV